MNSRVCGISQLLFEHKSLWNPDINLILKMDWRYSEGKAMEMEWNEMLLLQSTTAMFDGRLRWEKIQPVVLCNISIPIGITSFLSLVFRFLFFMFPVLFFDFFCPCRGREVLLSFDPESFPTFFCFHDFSSHKRWKNFPMI